MMLRHVVTTCFSSSSFSTSIMPTTSLLQPSSMTHTLYPCISTSLLNHSFCTFSSSSSVGYTAPPLTKSDQDSKKSNRFDRNYGPDKSITAQSRRAPPYKVTHGNHAGPYEARGQVLPIYPKRKNARKRTTGLLKALETEEAYRLIRDGRARFAEHLPRPKAGQILRIGFTNPRFNNGVEEKEKDKNKNRKHNNDDDDDDDDDDVLYFNGIVMAVKQRMLGSTVILRNVIQGISVERAFPLYSPLIKSVQVIGNKRVVRNKLYYLREKPLRESTFGNAVAKPSN